MRRLYLTISALLGILPMAFATQVGVYCYLSSTGTETYQDDNLLARIVITDDGCAVLEVENLTDRILFVDRGRSFSWINGESAPMFIPQSDTESHTYGLHTIEEEDPQHRIYVSQESHTYSHTVYDQRIKPIAPRGKSVVYSWNSLKKLMDSNKVDIGNTGGWFRYHCRGRFCDTGRKFEKGDSHYYTPDNTPLYIKADLEYSFEESGTDRLTMHVADYVARIDIGSRDGISKHGILLSRGRTASPCFAFRSGKPFSHNIGEFVSVASLVALYVAIKDMSEPPEGFGEKTNW